jgi:hypothetical protein
MARCLPCIGQQQLCRINQKPPKGKLFGGFGVLRVF